jgi:sialidase-1
VPELLEHSIRLFPPAESTYAAFRIPAAVRTGPWLLAFAEGRRHSAVDTGEIDLVLRRSDDNGRTWGPMSVVGSAPGYTWGNPAPVVDPASGDVVLLSVRNPAEATEEMISIPTDGGPDRSVWQQRSRDAGATWSEPTEITAEVKADDWAWYAVGPGHGIALRHEPYAGRLVVPANHSLAAPLGTVDEELPRYHGAHALLSDDGGEHWRIGFVDRNDGNLANANESAVAELADGTLHFNARNHRGTGAPRLVARSVDGGESLVDAYGDLPDVSAPGVQGNVLALPDGRLLLSTPTDPLERRRLAVLVSEDGGRRWRPAYERPEAYAGYSDLVLIDDHRVGLLYEAGTSAELREVWFAVVDLGDR